MPTILDDRQIAIATARIESAQDSIRNALASLEHVNTHIGLDIRDRDLGKIIDTLHELVGEDANENYGIHTNNLDQVLANMPTYMGIDEKSIQRYTYLHLGQHLLAGTEVIDLCGLIDDVFEYFQLPRCLNAQASINGEPVINIIENTVIGTSLAYMA